MAKAKRIKTGGRVAGTPNKKSEILRDEVSVQFRCSTGFNKCVEKLIEVGGYKSKADLFHEAIQALAYRKLPGDFYWLNKIQ